MGVFLGYTLGWLAWTPWSHRRVGSQAPHHAHGGDHGLKRGVGGGPPDAGPPLGVREPVDGGRQVGLRNPPAVVDDRSGSARYTHPLFLRGARPCRDQVHYLAGKGGQQLGHRPQAAGVLGEEDVGGAPLSFFQEGGRHLGGAAVFDRHVYPGGLLELFYDGAYQGLAAAGIHHQGVGAYPRARSYHRQNRRHQQQGVAQSSRRGKPGHLPSPTSGKAIHRSGISMC